MSNDSTQLQSNIPVIEADGCMYHKNAIPHAIQLGEFTAETIFYPHYLKCKNAIHTASCEYAKPQIVEFTLCQIRNIIGLIITRDLLSAELASALREDTLDRLAVLWALIPTIDDELKTHIVSSIKTTRDIDIAIILGIPLPLDFHPSLLSSSIASSYHAMITNRIPMAINMGVLVFWSALCDTMRHMPTEMILYIFWHTYGISLTVPQMNLMPTLDQIDAYCNYV